MDSQLLMKIILQGWLILALVAELSAQSPGGTGIFRAVPPTESGILWQHTNGRSEHRYMPEAFGPGVAIFDYNNDGLMDIFLVNSGDSTFFRSPQPLHPALYRNNGDGTFTDVTEKAGLTANIFGMGVAVGDYDGDGFADIFLTGYGAAILYHNNGNGSFTDVTAQSGIHEAGWSTGALWFDYNNDGKLDLFVGEYLDYSSLRTCGVANAYGSQGKGAAATDTLNYYCTPRIFKSMPSHLYRNDGGGHFTDVSEQTGILDSRGKGLGVVATDINNDGFMDIFQANDTTANSLFMNRGGKRFEEIGFQANVAYGENGATRSGMGVDATDFDGDGKQDLFVANIDQETFALYRNNGDETFSDLSRNLGIANATRLLSGWGLRFFDYDNDGLPDLILADGHPDDLIEKEKKTVTYQEPLLLFYNEGNGKMTNVSANGGDAFRRSYAARGLAVGDLNNDGYPDVVVGINGGAPLILYNNAQSKNNWVGLKLIGKQANADAIGATVRWSCGGQIRSRLKTAGGSFLSSHDPREILGVGKCTKMDWVEIRWPRPSTRVERLSEVPLNRYLTVVEDQGIAGK
jgi:enediyne biosynthesis protein E4